MDAFESSSIITQMRKIEISRLGEYSPPEALHVTLFDVNMHDSHLVLFCSNDIIVFTVMYRVQKDLS